MKTFDEIDNSEIPLINKLPKHIERGSREICSPQREVKENNGTNWSGQDIAEIWGVVGHIDLDSQFQKTMAEMGTKYLQVSAFSDQDRGL